MPEVDSDQSADHLEREHRVVSQGKKGKAEARKKWMKEMADKITKW